MRLLSVCHYIGKRIFCKGLARIGAAGIVWDVAMPHGTLMER